MEQAPRGQRGFEPRCTVLEADALPPDQRGGPQPGNRLVGLVVKASASRAEDHGFEFRLRRDFFGVESYQ